MFNVRVAGCNGDGIPPSFYVPHMMASLNPAGAGGSAGFCAVACIPGGAAGALAFRNAMAG